MAIFSRGRDGVLYPWHVDAYKGEKGDPGDTPNITIGTVTTVGPNEQASATLSGPVTNLVLNLVLPRGQDADVATVNDLVNRITYLENNVLYCLNDESSVIDLFDETDTLQQVNPVESLNIYDVVASTFNTNYYLAEILWTLSQDSKLNCDHISGMLGNLSIPEQAKVIINHTTYDYDTLSTQLLRYCEMNIITEEEFNELSGMMEQE